MGALDEITEAIASVAASAGPSVVSIGVAPRPEEGEGGWGHGPGHGGRGRGRGRGGWSGGLGSGVVIAEGKVLTNAHNVRAEEVSVTFSDGRTETGTLAGIDLDGDLAVVSVATGAAPAIAWPEDTGTPGIGAGVFALANGGGRGLRVTYGQVSSVGRGFRGPRGRRIAGSIEHTAPMAHGSSGGPVVDGTGRLVALNTNRAGEGFYLALPADTDLARRVEGLSRGETPYRPHLGIGIIPGRMARRIRQAAGLPEQDGLLVRVVEDDSAAAAAGLTQGDYIVKAGTTDVAGVEDLYKAMEGLAAGATLELTLLRGTEQRTVGLTLPEAPAA
jgi:S1-C subfamily serine protease